MAGSEDVCGAYADLYIARTIRKAQMMGIDPRELLKKDSVVFEGKGDRVDIVFKGGKRDAVLGSVEQRGWHGSGAWFDFFSSLKIGTGEGNQSFGWGQYLGGAKATGEAYMRAIGGENGVLYEVELPDDHVLLDFGALMKDQPDAVKQAVDKFVAALPDEDIKYGWPDVKTRAQLKNKILNEWDGADFYGTLSSFGDTIGDFDDPRYSGIGNSNDRNASLALAAWGLAGHKYLDQVSRAEDVKDKTFNYVIYDPENTLEIISRNGEKMPWGTALDDDTLQRGQIVDNYGSLKKHAVHRVMRTPLVLQMLGLGIVDKDIVISTHAMHKTMRGYQTRQARHEAQGKRGKHQHEISPDELKTIPEKIANPLMIFSSTTSQRGKDDSGIHHENHNALVVAIEMTDVEGAHVVATLDIEDNGDNYEIVSINARTKDDEVRSSNPKYFYDQIVNNKSLLYIDKNRGATQTILDEALLASGIPKASPLEQEFASLLNAPNVLQKHHLVNARREAGFTAYQSDATSIQGQTTFTDTETVLSLFRDAADKSTFIHEMGIYSYKSCLRRAVLIVNILSIASPFWFFGVVPGSASI